MVPVKDPDQTQVAFTDGEQLVRTGDLWRAAAEEQSLPFFDQTPSGKRRSSGLFWKPGLLSNEDCSKAA
jgi:hypothetical protein